MSAPETNIEKQKRHHWPVLAGIAAAVIIVVVAIGALSPVEETAEEVAETTG